MSQIVRLFVGFAALATVLVGTFAAAADLELSHPFKLTLVSELQMDIQSQKQKVIADTALHYTWKQTGSERTLSFDSVRVKAIVDGKELMATFMSRAKFANRQDGTTDVIPFEKAPVALQKILHDSFGVPLCKLQVDKVGKEVKRELLAGPGAEDFVAKGTMSNAMMFHAPFVPDQNEWDAGAEITLGNGGFVKGNLVYHKGAVGKGKVPVKVSGTLTNDAYNEPGSPLTIENARYVVNGDQTYDPARREWVSGKLTLDVSFDLSADGNSVGQAKGTIIANLALLPSQKKSTSATR